MSKPFNFKRVTVVSFIVLLAVLFALEFGPGSRRGGPGGQEAADEVVAHVGKKKILMHEVINAINPEVEPLLKNPELAELVKGYYLNLLEQVVDVAFLEQQAPREGIAISNAELLAHLQQTRAFQKEGQFDPDTYRRLIHANGFNTVAFEKEERARRAGNKLLKFLHELSYVSDEELRAEYALGANMADVRFVRFSPAQLAARVGTPTAKELAAFVEKNSKTIEETYEKNSHSYVEPERLRLRQILIARPEGEAEEAARQKAEALLASLQQGADFASVARESSEDLETRANSGDMGWIAASQLPVLSANAVLALKAGETSQLMETPRGYFIYKLEEREGGKPKPLQEVQQDIALTLWTQQKSEQQAYADAKQALAELLKGKGLDALFPAPVELGALSLTPQLAGDKPVAVNTGLFAANNASIPQLGDVAFLKNLIFQTTAPGPIREIQTLGQDFLVMEVVERHTPSDAGFEAEKGLLRETVRKQRAQQTQTELMRHMKAKAAIQLFPEKLKRLSGSGS